VLCGVLSCILTCCEGRGNCVAGICECNSGVGGSDCSYIPTSFDGLFASSTSNALRPFEWSYFSFTVTQAISLQPVVLLFDR